MAAFQLPVLGLIAPTLPTIVGIPAIVLYITYRLALPKLIPGIPYNKEAVETIFGDVPSIIQTVSETNEMWNWLVARPVKHNPPIFQTFARPLAKPWVCVTDSREAQDIMMRRTNEFDRSNFIGDLFVGVIPDHHINKQSSDPKFKANRMLIRDLVTPTFLSGIGTWSGCVIFPLHRKSTNTFLAGICASDICYPHVLGRLVARESATFCGPVIFRSRRHAQLRARCSLGSHLPLRCWK